MNNLKGSMLSKNEAFVVVDLDILLIKATHLFVYKSYTYIYMQLFSYCSLTWYCGINTLVKLAEALQIFKSRFYCSAFCDLYEILTKMWRTGFNILAI